MADSAIANPRSNSDPNPPKLSAPKDKNCPFCHQAFTSSSLGRHLDLYVKQKNPKPPDGIHIVEEIRKIRGGITRRQARNSTTKKDGSVSSAGQKPSISGDASPAIVQSPTMEAPPDASKVRIRLNEMSWHTTGVINDIPPRVGGAVTPELRRDVSRHVQQKAGLDQRQKLSEEWENLKAAELALKEVLRSVKEASVKTTGFGLFDFDPYTLNFPSLCLHILPAPTTLFSPTPFPTSESWSINPPGQKQFDALNRQVRERLLAHQRQRQINQLYPPSSNPASAASSPLPTPPLFDPDPQKLFAHLADAFSHWSSLSDRQRSEAWQLEILRSYARMNDMRKETELSLENARREVEVLKANRRSSSQTQSSNPPASQINLNIGLDAVKEIGKQGMELRNWDYDHLIEKWKGVVRENRKAINGMAAQRSLSTSIPTPQIHPGNRSFSMGNLPNVSNVSANASGTATPTKLNPSTSNSGTEDGGDQGDGSGDDEDADADMDAEAASDEGSLPNTQQNLQQQRQQQQARQQMHAQAQAQAQAQAHAQAQAQAHAQAQAQAQAQQAQQAHLEAQAWARNNMSHMGQPMNQHHQHQHHPGISQSPVHMSQPSTHPSHMGSNSRPSGMAMIDQKMEHPGMNAGSMMPMEGIEGSNAEQFLRMGMGVGVMPEGFEGAA